MTEEERMHWTPGKTFHYEDRGCQVKRTESQSHRAQWEKRRVLCVLESQQLMKDLPGQSLKGPSMCVRRVQ